MAEFYIVTSDLTDVPIREHLLHGYESCDDFAHATLRLVGRWKGRVGECVGDRHGFLLLRFHDTPGGCPDEEWIPRYLLKPVENPEYQENQRNKTNDDMENAFGFD